MILMGKNEGLNKRAIILFLLSYFFSSKPSGVCVAIFWKMFHTSINSTTLLMPNIVVSDIFFAVA